MYFMCLFKFAADFWTLRLVSKAMNKLRHLICFTVLDIVAYVQNFVKHDPC